MPLPLRRPLPLPLRSGDRCRCRSAPATAAEALPTSASCGRSRLLRCESCAFASLAVLERLAPLEPKLRQRRKSLADQVGRAAESIALNVSEARLRAGLDRADLFRRAAGSASELTTALRIAPGTRPHHARRLRRRRCGAGSGSHDAVAAHPLSGRWTSGRSWPGRGAPRGSRPGSSASCSASTSNATRRPGPSRSPTCSSSIDGRRGPGSSAGIPTSIRSPTASTSS
ncbi:MAG: four helix bundle protein [Deltaproteobacteria bacterium]|nr:MAG: four helix bundle protein [Deltaproteobacteria bacterium]